MVLSALTLANCQADTEAFQNAAFVPLVIITDMEPDDRIAMMLASDLFADRMVMVGTSVRHAGRKRDLAARALRQDALENILVVQGSGGAAEDYPDVISTRPARLYQNEGKGILSDDALRNYRLAPRSSTASADALINRLAGHEQVEIIALAPLTDLAAALAMRPDLAKRISRLHIMGGWTLRKGIKRTSYNWTMDAAAANQILALKGVPIYLHSSHVFKREFIGGSLNTANAPRVIKALLAAHEKSANIRDFSIAAQSWDHHVIRLIPALAERIKPHAGQQFSPSDPFTVLAAADDKLVVSARPVFVQIDLEDLDGQSGYAVTVTDDPKSAMMLVESMNAERFRLLLEDSFNRRSSVTDTP